MKMIYKYFYTQGYCKYSDMFKMLPLLVQKMSYYLNASIVLLKLRMDQSQSL